MSECKLCFGGWAEKIGVDLGENCGQAVRCLWADNSFGREWCYPSGESRAPLQVDTEYVTVISPIEHLLCAVAQKISAFCNDKHLLNIYSDVGIVPTLTSKNPAGISLHATEGAEPLSGYGSLAKAVP